MPRIPESARQTYLQHEVEQCQSVILPQRLELVLWRELVTAQLQGDLKAVGLQVVVVLHSYAHIPQQCWARVRVPRLQSFLVFFPMPVASTTPILIINMHRNLGKQVLCLKLNLIIMLHCY